MKSRQVQQAEAPFDGRFLQEAVALLPSLCVDSASLISVKMVDYLKVHYKVKGRYRQLEALDARVRKSDFNFKFTHDELVSYVELLFVQTAFIVENYVELSIEDHDHIARLPQYMKMVGDMTLSVVRELKLTDGHKNINVAVERMEKFYKRYNEKYPNVLGIADSWWCYLYATQMESTLHHARLHPQLKKNQLKSIATESILEKLAALSERNPHDPEFVITLLTYEAANAYVVKHRTHDALALLSVANERLKHANDEGAVPVNALIQLSANIKMYQLMYSATTACEHPHDEFDLLQASIGYAFEFEEAIDQHVSDAIKISIQESLKNLFDALLLVITRQFGMIWRDGFSPLYVSLEQLKRLLSLIGKTSTIFTSEHIAKVAKEYQVTLTQFTTYIAKTEADHRAQKAKNEEKFRLLIDQEKKYDELFPKLLDIFRQKQRKPPVIKSPWMNQPPQPAPEISTPEPTPVEEIEYVSESVAERCYQFYQTHAVKHSLKLFNQSEEKDRAEVMLCIGDQYRSKSNYLEALSWLENALTTAQTQPSLNQPLIDGIRLSLNLCQIDIAAELAFFEPKYKNTLSERKQFIRQLGVESFGIDSGKTEAEIVKRGKAIFAKLGQRSPEDSPKTKERLALKEHVDMLSVAKAETNKLVEQVSILTNKITKATAVIPTVSTNPAGLYHKSQPPKKTPAKPKANMKHKK